MKFIDTIRKWFSVRETKPAKDSWSALLGSDEYKSRAGFTVNETTALQISVLWRAARVISESIGGLPFKLFKEISDRKTEAKTHPLFTILHTDPNPDDSAEEFWTMVMFWAVIWNNSYIEVVRNGAGEVVALYAIPPYNVTVENDPDGTIWYQVTTESNKPVRFERHEILHIKGPSLDGVSGTKLMSLAKDSLSLSLACDRYGAAYFGNSTQLGGTLETAGELSEQARENLRKSWRAAYQGVDKAGSVALLEQGLTYKPFERSNEQGQYNETRTAQIYEVCRWIGVDPIFVFEYGRATWANGELQYRNFLKFTLNPWLKKIEGEVRKKCLLESERKKYYPEFVRQAIIELDAKTQHEIWKIGVDGGWYDPNIDIRPWLNLEPLPEPKQPEPIQPTDQQAADQGDNNQDKNTNLGNSEDTNNGQ